MRKFSFSCAAALLTYGLVGTFQSNAAAASNLLVNGEFDHIGPNGSPTSGHNVPSAAKHWFMWSSTIPAQPITSELLPSTRVAGGTMIHVISPGGGGGLFQDFTPGQQTAYACAWIYVVAGSAGIGIGDGGNTYINASINKLGTWERVEISNGVSPANEFIVYAGYNPGMPEEFYVDSVQVTPERESRPCAS